MWYHWATTTSTQWAAEDVLRLRGGRRYTILPHRISSFVSTTEKSYISSLNVAHTLSGTFNSNLNSDPCVKLVMRGAENFANVNGVCKTDRLPMNIHLLNILRHRISELPWSPFSKQIFWMACTVCFLTSCRMEELVPSQEQTSDARTTLLWDNVREINNTEFVIFIPYS